ncbi:MAG: hypothetical protein U9Q03_04620 [Patescibacteria group bacterium]|nr:hypothetical protein [Patescibacteria group bacterium]
MDPEKEDGKGQDHGPAEDIDIGPRRNPDTGETLRHGDPGYNDLVKDELVKDGQFVIEKSEEVEE